jgi:hypothetical protein
MIYTYKLVRILAWPNSFHTDKLTVLLRRLLLLTPFLTAFCAIHSAIGQIPAQIPVKCATPLISSNPKAKSPLFALPIGITDSIFSPSHLFLIHFDMVSADTDSITTPAFAEHAAEDADSAYDFEVNDLGYTPPAFTANGHYDIYLVPLHLPNSQYEAYGLTAPLDGGDLTPSPSGNERTRSYCMIDNAFESNIYATKGYDAERITIFHEFFHLIQFSEYGHPPENDVFFQEMTSVWMEWLSTPNVKDYLNYVDSYLNSLDTRFDLSPSSGYGQYLYFAYLTHRFDTGIVKEIWTCYRDSSTDPITCIDRVLRRHGSSFCMEYQRFGAELMQTGRRYAGISLLPDAQVLDVDTIQVSMIPADSVMSFVTFALSLQFAGTGSGNDTCIAVIARDTDRMLESNATIELPSSGQYVFNADTPSAYCDTEVCLFPLTAGVQVFPNPFVLDGHDSAYLQASTLQTPPVSVVLDVYSLNSVNMRHAQEHAEPVRGAWNATWDGRDDNGHLVESGEYIYTLLVDGTLKVGKIVVVRK